MAGCSSSISDCSDHINATNYYKMNTKLTVFLRFIELSVDLYIGLGEFVLFFSFRKKSLKFVYAQICFFFAV